MNSHGIGCCVAQTILPIVFVMLFTARLPAQSQALEQVPLSVPDNLIQDGTAKREPGTGTRAPLSSVPWFLQDMRNSVGFSVGVYGAYIPNNVYGAYTRRGEVEDFGGTTRSLRYGWLTPNFFANIRRKHTQVYLDYTFQFRASSAAELNGHTQTATLQIERSMSPKVSIQFGDVFTSTINDRITFLTPPPFAANEGIVAQDLDVPIQRVTWNSLSTRLNYRMSKRNDVSAFASYDFWQYSNLDLGRTHGIMVGVQSRYQINKWLYLDNSYSHYVNAVDNPARGNATQIHRLQIGGLRFARSHGGFEASLSGGMDVTGNGNGHPQAAPSIQVGLSRTWDSGNFSVVYRRGFWTAVGPGNVVEGNSVTTTFNQSLRRLNFNVGSSYRRGSSSWNTAVNSSVDFLTGSAGLGIAVQRHLLLSLDYAYVSQEVANISPDIHNVSRSSMGIGITYYQPSLFSRGRNSRSLPSGR